MNDNQFWALSNISIAVVLIVMISVAGSCERRTQELNADKTKASVEKGCDVLSGGDGRVNIICRR